MSVDRNTRDLEPEIERDFSRKMSYGSYLGLDELLSAQHPVSGHHDEMLFHPAPDLGTLAEAGAARTEGRPFAADG